MDFGIQMFNYVSMHTICIDTLFCNCVAVLESCVTSVLMQFLTALLFLLQQNIFAANIEKQVAMQLLCT